MNQTKVGHYKEWSNKVFSFRLIFDIINLFWSNVHTSVWAIYFSDWSNLKFQDYGQHGYGWWKLF